MRYSKNNNILKRYLNVEYMQKVMNEAIREALTEHKKAGNKVPVWDNGQIVYVKPLRD